MQLVSNNKSSATQPGCQSLPRVVPLAAGVVVAYIEFSSVRDPVADLSTLILYTWIVILDSNLGYFHVEKNKYKEGDQQIIY